MDDVLILTTPHIRGRTVKDAQYLLAGHNVWEDRESPIHVYYGRVDGEFGPETAGAAKRAKWWLGYPSNQVTPTFGPLLFNLLHGDSHLSAEWAARRAKRLEAAQDPLKAQAFAKGMEKLGTKEHPFGSNQQMFGDWYGMNRVPWCAIFLSWCMAQVGRPSWRYSYVPTIYADAVRGLNGMSTTFEPQHGDIVCYTFDGNVNCHTGFFDRWASSTQQEFYDLSGNSGPANLSNGGEVVQGLRRPSQVQRFVRLTL